MIRIDQIKQFIVVYFTDTPNRGEGLEKLTQVYFTKQEVGLNTADVKYELYPFINERCS